MNCSRELTKAMLQEALRILNWCKVQRPLESSSFAISLWFRIYRRLLSCIPVSPQWLIVVLELAMSPTFCVCDAGNCVPVQGMLHLGQMVVHRNGHDGCCIVELTRGAMWFSSDSLCHQAQITVRIARWYNLPRKLGLSECGDDANS